MEYIPETNVVFIDASHESKALAPQLVRSLLQTAREQRVCT